MKQEITIEQRTKMVRANSNWFFWIAGTSMLTSILYAFDISRSFSFGLVITQFIDDFTHEQELIVQIIGWIINLCLGGAFIYFGYKGRKLSKKFITIGLILYVADTLLLLTVQNYREILWHLLPIIFLFISIQQVQKIELERDELSELGKDILLGQKN